MVHSMVITVLIIDCLHYIQRVHAPFNSKFIFIYLFIHLFVSDTLLLVAYKYCFVATGERCSQSPLRAATCTCNFKTAKNPTTSKQSLLHESFPSHVLTTFTTEWFAHMREGFDKLR